MKVFVTGGTGFVGSHLIAQLLDDGHRVSCLARSPQKAEALFPNTTVRIVPGDLHDTQALERGCAGSDAIFHVAGAVAARSQHEFRSININATSSLLNVAERCAPNLQRFVHVSSLAAVGPSAHGQPHRGDERARPVSDYGWSKLGAEEVVRKSALPWTIVRPPTVYGPRDTEVLKLFKFARMGIIPIFGDGSQENCFVFGPDLAKALAATLLPGTARQVFFACHPEIHTQRAFATTIFRAVRGSNRAPKVIRVPPAMARVALWITGNTAKLLRRPTILTADKANEFLATAWTCAPEALGQVTGWNATHDLAGGIDKTVAWYREEGWL